MPASKSCYVYILTNTAKRPLYVGVTSDLIRRIHEHRQARADNFTSRYNLTRLVHFECFDDIRNAIQREKTLKHWLRSWKIDLIERDNADWEDLFEEICR